MDNERRIQMAALAVGAYIYAAQQPGGRFRDESIDHVVIDLLSDLRHYCTDCKIDFDRAVRISASHFAEESLDDA